MAKTGEYPVWPRFFLLPIIDRDVGDFLTCGSRGCVSRGQRFSILCYDIADGRCDFAAGLLNRIERVSVHSRYSDGLANGRAVHHHVLTVILRGELDVHHTLDV